VVVLGEDVGVNGGVFRATAGLHARFGSERVIDTPLDETSIAGLAVGMAFQGMKPVAEAQFDGFIYPMMDHIVCHAARMRTRTRGRLHCPMVLRAPWGGGIRAPEHHSEAPEALFAHMPGLRVVIPSSPARAYGLLLAAIRDPDPGDLLRTQAHLSPIQGRGAGRRRSAAARRLLRAARRRDVTLVTWGAHVKETLEAADALATEGIGAEVIDVATVKPLDFDTIHESVKKTGRCVIVHEATAHRRHRCRDRRTPRRKAMFDLVAPVERVTGYDTPMPLFRLEMKYLPSRDRIVAAAKKTLAYR
jgi:2-oxoisovalerate dehydrogenase E1 component beta subunit